MGKFYPYLVLERSIPFDSLSRRRFWGSSYFAWRNYSSPKSARAGDYSFDCTKWKVFLMWITPSTKKLFLFHSGYVCYPSLVLACSRFLEAKTRKWKVREKGGEAGKRKKEGEKKQLKSETPCDLSLEPMLPAVCEKNVFRFFRSSASGKPHFSLQQHNAKSAEFKAQLFKDHCL